MKINDLILDYIYYENNRIIFKNLIVDIKKEKQINNFKKTYYEYHFVPCVSFTSYINENIRKQYNISYKNIANQMEDDPVFFADVFSEFILKLLNCLFEEVKKVRTDITFEEIKKHFYILPSVASTKERTYSKFYRLFELISKKTGINNGYEYVYNKLKTDIQIGKIREEDFAKYVAVELYKLNSKYKLIFIDDVINTGDTFNQYAKRVFNNNSSRDGKFLLFLSFEQVFNNLDYKFEEYDKLNEKIIKKRYFYYKSCKLKNGFYKINNDILKAILVSACDSFDTK